MDAVFISFALHVLRSLAHPGPPFLDQLLVEVHAIRQDHYSNRALVLVVAVGLEHDFFLKGEGSEAAACMLAERLAFLGAVDATEADTFSMVAVQDFEGVAVDQAHY
jgi:hypothetical protein